MNDEKHRNYDSKSGINAFFWLNHLIGEKSPLNYALIGKSAFLPSLVDPPSNNDLFVFMDVDMIYDENYVRRIRRNTVQGQRVYYPVFLSEYNPAKVYNTADFPMPDSHFQITERHGYWRYYSYGMVAIYKSDFDATGGFDLSIEGWGLEDLRLAGSCLDAKLHILRTVDESLIHVFHDKFCDPELDEKQMNDCIATKASHYGPKIMLYGGYKRNYTSSSISHAEIKV